MKNVTFYAAVTAALLAAALAVAGLVVAANAADPQPARAQSSNQAPAANPMSVPF
ncbi:hypothetical protein LF41_328 [Lysobacter dokdonensis DS-58]|uniref:Uncharacterized protein n=1 Tax=Lysobacter dokdonensis DS-58 TaxID=1300345 RepID=A0A0A2WKJ8_9GAMM|nr:hypothetical protein [Lysobacter dokdonensis]KGQ18795.1 hypothetical protein LF41_328 [Lysobacter dokdonensis DS-58]